MTNTHRKTTNRTTAKIAAVGAFGIGAAIALPGLAAAQEAPAESPTASLENLGGEDGSLEGALGTDVELDLGSLSFTLNLDAETPSPGSVELGSLGVSPNTGSSLVDGDSGSASGSADGDESDETGSLGSLTGGSGDGTDTGAETGSAGSLDDDATDGTDETGSLDTGSLAGLSSGADTDDTTGAAATGSLG